MDSLIPVLNCKHADITADSLSGLMAQGLSPRLAFLQFCDFKGVGRDIQPNQVRIVEGK